MRTLQILYHFHSVVTSVSVVMDAGSRNQTHFTDAAGKPVSKPSIASHIASPINLLNPDRYEFFTFDDNGELVKRLMTLEEIQGIIASGDGEEASYDSAGTYLPEKKVEDILNNVQNVLKEKMKLHKNSTEVPMLDTPDVSSTWNMILPVIFGNQNDSINSEKQEVLVTVDDPVHKPITIGHRPIFQQKPNTVSHETSISGDVNVSERIEVTTEIVKANVSTPQPITSQQDPDTPIISVSIISNKKPDDVGGEIENSSPIISIKPTATSIEMTPDIVESTKNVDAPSNKLPTISKEKITTPTIVQEISTTTKVELSSKLPAHNLEDAIETTTLDKSPVKEEQIDLEQPVSNPKDSITHANSSVDINTYSNILQPPKYDFTDLMRKNYSTLAPPSPSPSVPSPFTLKDVQSYHFSTQSFEVTSNTTTSDIIEEITTRKSTTSSLYEDFTLPIRGEISSISSGFKESVHEAATEQLPTVTKTITNTQIVQEELDSSASTSFTHIEGKDKFTTPLLIIIKENVHGNQKPLETSTQSLLSTFFYINGVNRQTTKNIGTSTESDNIVKTTAYKAEENDEKETNTTKYEKLDFEVNSSKEVVEDSNQDKEAISFKQTLDDLVTSTLVNDINTEFSSLGSTIIDEDVTQPTLKYSHTTQPYLDTTTERNLISSIDQLISQATTNTEEFVNDKIMGERIEDILNNMTQKPMQQVQSEAMTIASSLLNTEQSISATQVNQFENDQLSEAVNSLLSQVYGTEQRVLTTGEDFTTTTSSWLDVDQTTVNNVKETVHDSVLLNFDHKQNAVNKENITKQQMQGLETTKKENNDLKTTTENVGEVFYTKINDMLIELKNITADNEAQTEVTESQTKATDLSNVNTHFEQSQTSNVANYKGGSEFETKPFSTEVTTEQSKLTISFIPETNTEFVETTKRSDVEINTKKENDKMTTANDLKEQESHFSTSLDQLELSSSTPKEWIHLTNFETEMKKESIQTATTEKIIFETHSTEVPIKTSIQSFKTSTSTKFYIPTTTELNSVKEGDSNVWTLVSTVIPHSSPPPPTTDHKTIQTLPPIKLNPEQSSGLEDSISSLDTDVNKFIQLCNELSFGFWDAVTTGISTARSVFVSPFATTSLLAMIFLGAKGATSNEMNEILQLDDMVTFNPHLIFKNVTESIMTTGISGVATSVLIRELYSDVNKGKLLSFYKERARFFYDGYVEEVNFKDIGDIVRRRTNLLVKKFTSGKIQEYLKDSSIRMRTPLAGFSSSIYQVSFVSFIRVIQIVTSLL